jgi:hypothetical protein
MDSQDFYTSEKPAGKGAVHVEGSRSTRRLPEAFVVAAQAVFFRQISFAPKQR